MPSPATPKTKLIIDTDVDVDDWMAMLFLLNHPKIEVVGITVVGTGAAHLLPGVQNALNLVQLAGFPELPVAKGLGEPMAYDHCFPPDIRAGVDDLFGIQLPNNPRPPEPCALSFLRQTLESATDKLQILAIGPLTNLGTLLSESPELAQRIERIHIMGGAIDTPGNVSAAVPGNPNDTAEFNLYCDPVAADVVFRAGVPITLVPLDATQHAPISPSFYLRLLENHTSAASTFVYQALTKDYPFIASGDFDFWDPLAAALLSQPDLGVFREVAVTVHTADDARSGQLLVSEAGAPMRVCFDVAPQAFEDLFLSTLEGTAVAREQVTFVLDGKRVTLDDVSPKTRLIDYLHQPETGKQGTKIACGQGGCGACTVMLTRYDPTLGKMVNLAINSCLRPVVTLDGTMITTTQGIGNVKSGIDEVQYKLAANNGSQCGFCSPGFVMNMFTLRQNRELLTEREIECHFDGNICRCTGYRPILDAFRQFATDYKRPEPALKVRVDPSVQPCAVRPFQRLAPPEDFRAYMMAPQPLAFSGDGYTSTRPLTLSALFKTKAAADPSGATFRLLCGNTSTGIYETQPIYSEPTLDPHVLVDISAIQELQGVDETAEGLRVGAATTLARLIDAIGATMRTRGPAETRGLAALKEQLLVVANHQIRNEASLGGNIHLAVNLGFLSDVVPVLAALHAVVTVATAQGAQDYPILELPTDDNLPPDAVYTSVFIPFTTDGTWVRAVKVRRRDDDCHALVTGGLRVQLDDSGRVEASRIVFNGISADYRSQAATFGVPFTSVLLTKTSQFLLGRHWNDATLQQVLGVLQRELEGFSPPEGPHGPLQVGQIDFSFRSSVARGLFFKFFVAVASQSGSCPISPSDRSAGIAPVRELSTGTQYFPVYPGEAPVSEPFVKLAAFLQTTGEATYTHGMERPPNTLEAAYVYSLIAFGQFRYALPITTALGRRGEPVSAAVLGTFLQNWHPGFVAFITYDDVPNKAANWIGFGGDDPVFVPSIDQSLPDSVTASDGFTPHHLTSVGAPIGVVVATSEGIAREIATFVRTRCIQFQEAPATTFEDALRRHDYFSQTPSTNPTLTHIPDVTRPGGNEAWLADPQHVAFMHDGQALSQVRGTRSTGYQNHFYLETMNTIAVPGENRTITLHTASQAIADNQYAAAGALGVPATSVQVRLTRIGGGFGGRQSLSHFNSTAAAIAAWVLDRPVRLCLDRNTNFIMCGERHAYVGSYEVAYDEEGTLHGYVMDLRSDGGNSYDMSFPVMDFSLQSNDNAYMIPSYKVTGQVCRTNKLSNTAFRSFGFVQAVNLTEQAIEQVAHALGKYPEEIRAQNMYANGHAGWSAFEVTAQTLGTLRRLRVPESALECLQPLVGRRFHDRETFGKALDTQDTGGVFRGAQRIILERYSTCSCDFTPYMEPLEGCNLRALWKQLEADCSFVSRRAEVEAFNQENRWRKRGISMMPLKYGISYSDPRGTMNQGGAYITAYSSDGSVLVSHGGVEMGQGLQTKLAQIAAQTLGIDLSLVRMADTDTRVVGDASPTAASTGSDLNGRAVQQACQALRNRLEKMCEDLEQYTTYYSAFDPMGMDAQSVAQMRTVVLNWREHWGEVWPLVCALAYANRVGLSAEARYKEPNLTSQDVSHAMGKPFSYYTYAVAASEVEVDVLTGEFTLLRTDVLFDVGKSLNPLIDLGQIEGGFIQGIGYLTTEELTFQGPREAPRPGFSSGALTSTNTWEYKPPGARSVPLDFRVRILGTHRLKNDLSATKRTAASVDRSKGIGEPPLVLANTVFFAIKQAVQALYTDRGRPEWVEMDAPATVANIQRACARALPTLALNPQESRP